MPWLSNIMALLSAEDDDPVQAVFPYCDHPYVTSCSVIWNFIPFLVCSFNSWKLWWDVHLCWTRFSNVSTALNNLTHSDAFYKLIFVAFFWLTWFTCQTTYSGFHRLFPSGDCISSFWQLLDSISKCNFCTSFLQCRNLQRWFLLLFWWGEVSDLATALQLWPKTSYFALYFYNNVYYYSIQKPSFQL